MMIYLKKSSYEITNRTKYMLSTQNNIWGKKQVPQSIIYNHFNLYINNMIIINDNSFRILKKSSINHLK